MVDVALSEFQIELSQARKYTLDGPVAQSFQPFIDYWGMVSYRWGEVVFEKDRPKIKHRLVQRFFNEQLAAGRYTLDTAIGREYRPFVAMWQEALTYLGRARL